MGVGSGVKMCMSTRYKGDIVLRWHVVWRSAEVISQRSCSSLLRGNVHQSYVRYISLFLTNTNQLWSLIMLGLLEHLDVCVDSSYMDALLLKAAM